ncbi:MAG: aldo/keto reductase [Candidatus Competibacteraceae bacterium]|nr:aldo/keto reductase [Candidatus Competibacteraceae bacterium]
MTTVSRIQLGPEGPQFSRLVWGTMRINQDVDSQNPRDLLGKIEECLAVGVTTFDHADIYGDHSCEALFGNALAEKPQLRQHIQLISKCGIMPISDNRPGRWVKHYDTSAGHIIGSVETSLRNLRTDYLDLLLIHRPDPLMDAEETAGALTRLRAEGKIRHYGVSNFSPWQFDLLQSRLDAPLVTNQVELSVLNPITLHNGILDQCQRLGIRPMAWSPLGGNALFFGDDQRVERVRQILKRVAGELGVQGIDQVALAWVLRHPARPLPVLGTNRIARIHTLAQAENLAMDRQQWFAILEAAMGHPVA